MADLVNLRGDDGRGLVCYTRDKRSREATPSLGAEKKQKPEPGSIDCLPDECLYEILRRLPGHRERSIAACVSKPWLMLLSLIRPSELNMAGIEDGINSTRRLTRTLDGSVTDVRVAAVAVGAAGRGGLDNLMITGHWQKESSDTELTDLGLSAVARCCPSFKSLTIWSAPNITDAGLAELARGCPMIENINLSECPLVTGKGLLAVEEKFTNLVSVVLDSCVSIGNEGLQAVGCCSPKLRSVLISDCPLIGDQGIAALMCSASSSLVELSLYNLNVSDFALDCIGHYGRVVTYLVLSDLQNVSESGFWRMGNNLGLQKLKSIDVAGCRGVTAVVTDGAWIRPVTASTALVDVKLRGCANLADSAICALVREHGECLQVLNLKGCNKLTDRVLVEISKHCKVLKEINMSGADITDYGVALLASTRQLNMRALSFAGCAKLTPRSLLLFRNMGTTLVRLNLKNCKLICEDDISSLQEEMRWCLIEMK